MAAILLLTPVVTRAHEVYVLSPDEIATGVNTPPFDMLATLQANLGSFVFWGFIVFVVVSTIFFMSIFRGLERLFDPYFARLKRHAATVARVTIGTGLVAGAYYGANYGPELPLAAIFGSSASTVAPIAGLVGLMLVVNLWTRSAAAIATALFLINVLWHGIYMLTYVNYLGEFIVLLTAAHGTLKKHGRDLALSLAPYSWVILRVTFGISLIYSSVYAKILHNHLALQVASLTFPGHTNPLAYYFGFEPHFLVLGAALIEILIGLFYIFGVEIRWTSIFLLFWLSLSLWFFGESVWPHIVLIGIPLAFIMHGYDKYSIEGYLLKRGRHEPVL